MAKRLSLPDPWLSPWQSETVQGVGPTEGCGGNTNLKAGRAEGSGGDTNPETGSAEGSGGHTVQAMVIVGRAPRTPPAKLGGGSGSSCPPSKE